MPDRLVIVVPDSEEPATRARMADLAALGWEQSIRLVGGANRRRAGDADFARKESRRILKIVDDFEAESLIVAKEICCDSRMLEARQDLVLYRQAVGLLRNRTIKRELENRGLHWRRTLEDRLTYWNSRKCDVDDWLRQFDHFNAHWVGEAILRQIDVIGPNEMVRAFQLPAQAMVGQDLVFTFIAEDDPASSSKRIGALLAQMYQRPQVQDFLGNYHFNIAGSNGRRQPTGRRGN